MSTIDIPDPEIVDEFLQVNTCPMCRIIGKKAKEISLEHDARICLNKHLILHYIVNHNQNPEDKELRKYTIKCMKEINKRRLAIGKIEI
jgi:hypothetical protein